MKKSLQQIFELLPTLVNNVKIAEDNIDDKQYSRRVYIRTLFAMIEGSIYAMKIALFGIGRESGSIKVPDLVVLKESSFDLSKNGKVKEKAKFFRIPENLRFTIRTIKHLLGKEIELGVGNQDWENLKKSIKIRNKVTHPKSLKDLNISDEALECIRSVNLWFNQIVSDMMMALKDHFTDEPNN